MNTETFLAVCCGGFLNEIRTPPGQPRANGAMQAARSSERSDIRPSLGLAPGSIAAERAAFNRHEFHLRISPAQYLDYYRGRVRPVLVRCPNGQTVQFSASLFQTFVAPEGIHGDFVLTSDEQHKCTGLQRTDTPMK